MHQLPVSEAPQARLDDVHVGIGGTQIAAEPPHRLCRRRRTENSSGQGPVQPGQLAQQYSGRKIAGSYQPEQDFALLVPAREPVSSRAVGCAKPLHPQLDIAAQFRRQLCDQVIDGGGSHWRKGTAKCP